MIEMKELIAYGIFVAAGYLSGSILFAFIIPKLMKKIDICKLSEDGNPGTYNAFKYGGCGCGILVILSELLKGALPVWLCRQVMGMDSLLFAFVMLAPVFGHAHSIFMHGKGGKAIAVSFGVMLGLLPAALPLILLIVWYLLFSLLLPVKNHGKRSIVTYGCFSITSILFIKIPSVVLGNLLIAGTVIHRHIVGNRQMTYHLEEEQEEMG